MNGPDFLTGEQHQLTGDAPIEATSTWLDERAARAVFTGGAEPGWTIENHDGTIVLAIRGDTLIYNGSRIRRAA